MNRNKPSPDPNAPFLAAVPLEIQPAPKLARSGPPGQRTREREVAIVADEKKVAETSLKFKKPDTMTQLDNNE